MESFRRAIELGADGFEFDVRRSADGRLVVVHNPRVGARFISRTPYDRLLATRRGANMPVLEQVLREFGRAWLDIEIKVPGVEEVTLELAHKFCTAGRFVISSFSRGVVSRLRELDADAPLGWLLRHPVKPERWQGLRLDYLAPHCSAVRRGLVEAARRDGLRLLTWTVNSRRVLRRVLELGVDVIVSDYPDWALGEVQSRHGLRT